MKPFTLTLRRRPVLFGRPLVMGILNVTPDSFYASSRAFDEKAIALRVRQIVDEGADIIDLGACSTRPGSEPVTLREELRRIELGMNAIHKYGNGIYVSVDTWRAEVARHAIADLGADIINDISGGCLDPAMVETVAELHCPYVLSHTRGTPADMQLDRHTDYGDDVTTTVISELQKQIHRFTQAGTADIIVDPGFGFAKTLEQNYQMLRNLQQFEVLGHPVLVGVSRKSMITKALNISAEGALTGTAAVNVLALDRGAACLRVHDVLAARQVCDLYVRTVRAPLYQP